MSTNQPPVADAVAGIGYECLLCGHRAHAYSADDGQTVEVWDLCRECNAAFHFLAVGLQLLEETAPAAVAQVPGQLELAEARVRVGTVVHLARWAGIPGGLHSVQVPACYDDQAARRLVSRNRTHGVIVDTADQITCARCTERVEAWR